LRSFYYQRTRYAGKNGRKLHITCQVVYAGENMKRSQPKLAFDLTGGSLCLNFANTLDKRLSSQPEDKLGGYEAFVAFGQQTGALPPSEARKLRQEGSRDKSEAARIFVRAVGLRELIFRIMSAVAAGRKVSEADTAALNAEVQKLNARSRISPVHGQSAWKWAEKEDGAGRLVGRILRSAVEILTSDDIERVKKCASEKCCWLFLDHSRSRNRRWCEMRTCGSQQKARAYYQRKTAKRRREKASARPG
jgi:predicted RNA-binding Zn ribbon-like protein